MAGGDDDRLELALRASNEGIWDWDVEGGGMVYSARVLRFLGCRRDETPHLWEDRKELVHPEDLGRFEKRVRKVLERKGRLLAVGPRMRGRGGKWRWFRVRGVPVRDEDGRVTRMVGSMIDITKRKKAERELREKTELLDTLIENIPLNVYFKDEESRFVRANQATARKLGAGSVAELVGRTDADFFRQESAGIARAQEKEIMRTGKGLVEKLRKESWADGAETWALATKLPWRRADGSVRGVFGVTQDVTELMRVKESVERAARALEETNRRIEDERGLLRLVIDNVPLNVYFKDKKGRFVLVNRAMARWFGLEDPVEIEGKSDADFFSKEHAGEALADERAVMETGRPVVEKLEKETWQRREDTWVMTSKYPWRDSEGKVKGTFGVSSDVSELIRTQRKLEEMATALQRRNQGMEEELKLAMEVQQALVPGKLPVYRGEGPGGAWKASFHHRYLPASELAGDFLEVIPLGDDRAGFLVCDVMGHGVRAALVVAMLRGLIEKEEGAATDPGAFLAGVNDGLTHLMRESSVRLFATALYGVMNLRKEEVLMASAGHPAPVGVFANGTRELPVGKGVRGPGLGMIPEARYGTVRVPFRGGDGRGALKRLLFFTDGLFEQENAAGEQFGRERMMETLAEGGGMEDALDKLAKAALAFSGKEGFEDDVCLLGLEVAGSGE